MEAEVLARDGNIAGQAPEGEPRKPWPEKADDQQRDAQNDKDALHCLLQKDTH
ncbi:hypothetical protein NTG1052_560062 [Candidatus Nitrotoga sp. 1052]|nr:hypothetical protein NTG1052_560062 [Candidatus Nitrotoga sp. 1052]